MCVSTWALTWQQTRDRWMLSQPKTRYLLRGQQTCICVCVRVCAGGNYFSLLVCMFVCTWRRGWLEMGGGWRCLSEVISPSHLIIVCLADSLDGSTARCCGAAVNRAVNACRNRCQSPSVSIFNWGSAPGPLIRMLYSLGTPRPSSLCCGWASPPPFPPQSPSQPLSEAW